MIFQQVDEIFEHYPECIVHPVSCTGVSHDILSKQIKKAYPDYFREYTRLCIRKKLQVGKAHFFSLDVLFGIKYIVTLTVKNNWQERIQPLVFKQAFDEFIKTAWALKLTTIAIPKMEEVPHNWLVDQLDKVFLNPLNTVEKTIFF